MLSKNQKHTVTIESMTGEGMGVARIDGQVVFVKNALPGELCEILILKAGKRAAWAKCLELIEPSPQRVESDCPHFGKCGGCDFRHMSYELELEQKRLRVDDALERIGGLSLKTDEIIGAAQQLAYRNKAQYPVSGNPPSFGFYRARSHQLIPISRCLLQGEEFDALAAGVIQWMRELSVPAYEEESQRGCVRHIYVRRAFATGQVMVCVVANARALPGTERLIELLAQACPELTSLMLAVNTKPGNVILGQEFVELYGPGYIEDELMGLRFRLSPASFYQINPAQCRRLYERVLDYAELKKGCTALDLYCGIGTIALTLAAGGAQRVIGAEIVPQAVENAKENARLNRMENAEFILADAGLAAKRLAEEGLHPDVITVDPPRKGLDSQVIDSIIQMAPKRLIYVSCDPATLARDLKDLTQKGYHPQKATALDMFPRCAHVETVVLLSKLHSDHHIEVELNLDEMDLTASESKATYDEIRTYVLEKFGLKVSNLYIAQIKQKCGIIERENYNKPKSEDSKQPQCPPEKEQAIVEALRHFRMI